MVTRRWAVAVGLGVVALAVWLVWDPGVRADRTAVEPPDVVRGQPLEAPDPSPPDLARPAAPRRDAAPTPLATPTEPTLQGRVVDAAGEPLDGATVTVASVWFDGSRHGDRLLNDAVFAHDVRRTWTTHTDADGRWAIVLPAGLCDPRRLGSRRGVVLGVEAHGRQRGVYEWDGARETETVALIPAAHLTGRLVDAVGEPIEDARVWAYTSLPDQVRIASTRVAIPLQLVEGWTSTTTNADGTFTTLGLVPGDTELIVDGNVVPRRFAFDDVAAGLHDVGDLGVFAGATVHGTVHDATGAPVAGARVYAAHLAPWVLEQNDGALASDDTLARHAWTVEHHEHTSVVTDEAGAFKVRGVTHRDVWITAEALGHGIAPRRVVLSHRSAHVDVVLPPPPSALVVDIAYGRGGLPESADRYDYYAESVYRVGEWADGSRKAAGHVAPITELVDGRLVIHRHGSIGVELLIAPIGRPAVKWFVPADVSSTTFPPPHGVSVRGRVVGAGEAARLEIVHEATLERHVEETAADGHFGFDVLPAGTWHVTATVGELAGHASVHVAEGDTVDDVTIDLAPTGGLTFDFGLDRRVILEARHLSTRAFRHDVSASPLELEGLLPGTWRLTSSSLPTTDVHVAPGETTHVSIRTPAPPRIVGRVRSDGEPITSGRVVVAQASSDVDADGRFEIAERLPTGPLSIAWLDAERGAFWFDGEVVPRVDDTIVHDIDVGVGTTVEVTVVDELTGAPLTGVPVSIASRRGLKASLGATDDDGRVVVSPCSGKAWVSIPSRAGFAPAVEALDVGAAADHRIELRTRRVGRLDLEPIGAPVANDDYDSWVALTVRLESTTTDEVVLRDTTYCSLDDVPSGTWRVVAVPAWRDVDAVPPGAGRLVEIRQGERTTVEVPLSY